MKIDHAELEQRRDEITEQLEEFAADDRYVVRSAARDRLEKRLAERMPPDMVTAAMQIRETCRHQLTTAMAMCESVEIRNGVVVITGTRAEEFNQRIAKYNTIQGDNRQSLAAFYLRELVS